MNDHINLTSSVLRGISIAPVSISATTEGSGVDLRDGGAETVAYIDLGVIDTGVTATVSLEQSKNNNVADNEGAADPYAAISGATASMLATSDGTTLTITTNARSERYVRAVVTMTGGAGNALVGVTICSPRRSAGAPQ